MNPNRLGLRRRPIKPKKRRQILGFDPNLDWALKNQKNTDRNRKTMKKKKQNDECMRYLGTSRHKLRRLQSDSERIQLTAKKYIYIETPSRED